ncbi:mycofactocin biosynthesis chaperone MftB [Actinoplanes subglobosus]|uniref:Mycofactocin biosynthesis chaperone MftB n=1 Tax=Actinoplanes subglobosus TaxID=1547892 RepID=A0ABV8J4T0_9ACTN
MSAGTPFPPGRRFRRSPQVALRPEPFGALAYHFGTRRLSFLKTPMLVATVEALEDSVDVHAALDRARVPAGQRAAYLAALTELAGAGTIEPVPTGPDGVAA